MKISKKSQTISRVTIRFDSMDLSDTQKVLNKVHQLLDQEYKLIGVSGWGGDEGQSRDWEFVGEFTQ